MVMFHSYVSLPEGNRLTFPFLLVSAACCTICPYIRRTVGEPTPAEFSAHGQRSASSMVDIGAFLAAAGRWPLHHGQWGK